MAYEYENCKLVRVVDGDTYYIEVDVGFKMRTEQSFRLRGVDTPETYRPKSEEELKICLLKLPISNSKHIKQESMRDGKLMSSLN